jgi:hypothetical protein
MATDPLVAATAALTAYAEKADNVMRTFGSYTGGTIDDPDSFDALGRPSTNPAHTTLGWYWVPDGEGELRLVPSVAYLTALAAGSVDMGALDTLLSAKVAAAAAQATIAGTHAGEAAASAAAAAETLGSKADKATTITGAGLATGTPTLGAGGAITVPEASDADADAGTSGTVVMTPRRATRHLSARRGAANGVASLGPTGLIPSAQIPSPGAIGAVPEGRTVTGGGLVSGGGPLTGNVTMTVTEASDAEAVAGAAADKVITPRRMKVVTDTKADKATAITGAGIATGTVSLGVGGAITVTEASDVEASAGSAGDKAMTPRRVKTALDDRIRINPGDGVAAAVLDEFDNVALAVSADGRDLILSWGTLRMTQGRLQILMSERNADTLTPSIARTADGKLAFGPDTQQIIFDPVTGQLQTGSMIVSYTTKGFVVADEHGAALVWVDEQARSTIMPGLDHDGIAGRTVIGNLTLVERAGGTIAWVDDLDQVFAEIGIGGPSYLSGWTFYPDGTLTVGGRSVIRPVSSVDVPMPTDPDYAPDADTQAVIAAQWIAQSFLRRQLQQDVMTILKRNGAYGRMRRLWIMDAADEQAAGLDWVTKSGTLSKHGTTAGRFIPDRGYTGNLTDFWLGTGYDLSSDGGITGDWLMFMEVATSGDSSVWDVGASDAFKVAARASGKLSGYAGSAVKTDLATDSPVHILWFGRVGGDAVMAVDAGALTSVAAASSGTPSGEVRLYGGFGTGALFSAKSFKKLGFMDGASLAQRTDVVEACQTWSRKVGSYREPQTSSTPYVTSDKAFSKRSSLEIPCLLHLKSRQTLTGSYGTRFYTLGTTGEGAPEAPVNGRQEGAFATFHQSRDNSATQTYAFSVVATGAANASMNDPQAELNFDGRAVILIPSTGPRKTVWGLLLQNPTASPADMVIEPPAFQGYGYTGRPRRWPDGTMRVGYYEKLPNDTGRVYGAGIGCHMYKLEVRDNAIVSTYVSTVPPPDNWDEAGMPVNNFQEPSFMPLIGGGVICFFRTELGIMWSKALNEVDWSPPDRLFIANLGINTSSEARCDLWRHSSGRPVLMLCDDPARDNMTICVGPVNGDGLIWEKAKRIDEREFSSYPSSTEDEFGDIWGAYDCERGRFSTRMRREINTFRIGIDDMVVRERHMFNI